MPAFTITAPDGSVVSGNAPEGTTQEEIMSRVMKEYTAKKQAAPAPTPEPAEDTSTTVPTTLLGHIQKYLSGGMGASQSYNKGAVLAANPIANMVVKGGIKGLAGPIQMGADMVAPSYGDAVSHFTQALIKPLDDKLDVLLPKMTEGDKTIMSAAEMAGQLLPYVLAPETAIVKGAGLPARLMDSALRGGFAGATTYQDAPTAEVRNSNRVGAAIGGGVLGGAAGTAGGLVTKYINNREVNKGLGQITDWLKDSDPSLREVRADISGRVDKVNREYERRSMILSQHQDLIGPIPLKDITSDLQTIYNKNANLKNLVDQPIQRQINQTLEEVAPYVIQPEKITSAKGVVFNRVKPGVYQMEGANKPLPQAASDALLEGWRNKSSKANSYSRIQAAVDGLDAAITKSKQAPSSATRATAEELKSVLQTKLDAWETPQLKRDKENLESWNTLNRAPLQNPALKDVVGANNPVDRANAVLKIALGDNVYVSKQAAELIGKQGQEAVFRGAVKKALEHAYDRTTNDYDAPKLIAFFKEKSALAPFVQKEQEQLIKGLGNYLSEGSLRAGQAPKSKLGSSYLGRHTGYGVIAGGVAALTGHGVAGLETMATSIATRPLFKVIDHVLNDSFGRNLLAAAAGVKPGSPRMARIWQTIEKRFIVPTVGQEVGRDLGENP